jgi:DNA-binding response OmpR family regulator
VTISPFSSGPPGSTVERPVEAPLILVADDHEDSRCIARIVLQSSGFRVVEARTGTEALSMARTVRPVALVLDIVMPELTGWDVARALRAESAGDQLVIIAVTALSDRSDRVRTIASGCNDMLVKPVHPRALIKVVQRHLARRESAEAGR